MVLNNNLIRKIEDFVYQKPRSVQEIAQLMKKNWRTVDRYISEIEKNYGTIATRVFRGGTKGALKIVYWASFEKASNSVFQEHLEEMVMKGKTKNDFSGFDIFQYVEDKNKSAWIKEGEDEVKAGRLEEFKDILLKAKRQILFFSGNLSFINLDSGKINIFNVLEQLIKNGVSIKIVCRVDIAGIDNIKRILSLNYKYGKNLIEIHHREQPLRAIIIDDKLCNIKEIKESTGKVRELDKKIFIFYTITDKEWIEWLSKIFWKMYSSSIDANKRIKEIEKINK